MVDSLLAKLFSAIESGKRRISDNLSQEGMEQTASVLSEKLKNLERDPTSAIDMVTPMAGTIGSATRVLGNEAAFQAQKLFSQGRNAEEVFSKTGIYKQKLDDQLRANISDAGYSLHPSYKNAKTLGEAIKHDELFRLYPEFRDIPFSIKDLPKGTRAAFGERDGIAISKSLRDDEAASPLIHEIQHAIQKAEGFTQGSSVQAMSSSKKFLEGMADSATLKQLMEEKQVTKDPRSIAQMLAERLYRLVGGEAEARVVQEQLLQKNWTANPYTRELMDVDPNILIRPR